MNLPNMLTTARMAMIPIYLIAQMIGSGRSAIFAAAIFLLASCTDFLDGYLARKNNLVTNYGKIMDPLADKLLVLTALIALCVQNKVAIWVVIIILARELGITSLRAVASSEGIVIAAGPWGKFKTVTQMVAIFLLILEWPFGTALIYIAVLLTIVSAVDYLVKFSRKISWQ